MIHENIQMNAHEAFIRRASRVGLPFMLKGSYVTRQYFLNPLDRIPNDLDWVCLVSLADIDMTRRLLNEWATRVTECSIPDGVTFRSFTENSFWRMIDYAMADDFPTVNTDIQCVVHGRKVEFGLDVSFNLAMEQSPVPLMYQPLDGAPFTIPATAPISLQVSWKIHQTLVRPRFKDLFDLMHLVQHPAFDRRNLEYSVQALVNECHADGVELIALERFLNFDIHALFEGNSIDRVWAIWRSNAEGTMTNSTNIPISLADFLKMFRSSLQGVGFDLELLSRLPPPTR